MYYKNSLPWSWHLGCSYLAAAATWPHGMLMCAHGADCTQLLGGADKTISCYVAKLPDLKIILREKFVCMIQLIFALLVLSLGCLQRKWPTSHRNSYTITMKIHKSHAIAVHNPESCCGVKYQVWNVCWLQDRRQWWIWRWRSWSGRLKHTVRKLRKLELVSQLFALVVMQRCNAVLSLL